MMKDVIITAPSLDPLQNVSGVSSVVNFIINNNPSYNYIHFQLGKTDKQGGGLARIKNTLDAFIRWDRFLKKYPSAVIHYNFPLSKLSLLRDPLFMWKAKRQKRKMLVHVHGGLFLNKKDIPFLWKKILKWVFSWNVPFIVLSEHESVILKKRFGAKLVRALPNCVDLKDATLFNRFEKSNNCRSDNILHIGYLGRIEPDKGMTELLEACVLLKEKGIPFKLSLAGKEAYEGEYLPHFISRLGDNFHYAGIVSGKSKSDYLKSLDIFILPSYFEGLPMSLLECMSYACVPIVTPVGSIPDVLKDGENGLFIKHHDVVDIVDKVELMYTHREKLECLGNSAKEYLFAHFSPEKYIDKLNKLYDIFGG